MERAADVGHARRQALEVRARLEACRSLYPDLTLDQPPPAASPSAAAPIVAVSADVAPAADGAATFVEFGAHGAASAAATAEGQRPTSFAQLADVREAAAGRLSAGAFSSSSWAQWEDVAFRQRIQSSLHALLGMQGPSDPAHRTLTPTELLLLLLPLLLLSLLSLLSLP